MCVILKTSILALDTGPLHTAQKYFRDCSAFPFPHNDRQKMLQEPPESHSHLYTW
jgi:hypothetical protein